MADVTMTATFIDGAVLRAVGFFDIEGGWESESNKLTLKLFPSDNKWEIVVGTGRAHGTPKKLTIEGVTYNVLGDANFNYQPSAYKNEPQPHTGGNSRKMTLQVRELGGVTISAGAADFERLRKLAETP